MILYDFFADSEATSEDWRSLSLHHKINPEADSGKEHSQKDPSRILQSELKSLYVGLTRAREHVWVWDTSDKGKPFEVSLWFSLLYG